MNEPQRKLASLRHLPVNLFASVMGLSGLSLAWRAAVEGLGAPTIVSETIGWIAVADLIVLLVFYGMKWVLYPEVVAGEFRHPVLANFFGTIPIAILLVSAVVFPHSHATGSALWVIGTVLTVLLAAVIVGRMLDGNRQTESTVPALIIPGVASLDIAVTGAGSPLAWAGEINLLALAIGGFLALVFFTLIVSRLVHQAPMPAGMTPSLIILIAPFEVGFLGYTNFFGKIDGFASILFYFGLFLLVPLTVKLFRKGIPFGAGWWAISFPLAALSNAALKYAEFRDAWPLNALAIVILGGLSAVIFVLFFKTLGHLTSGKLLRG